MGMGESVVGLYNFPKGKTLVENLFMYYNTCSCVVNM